MSFTGPRNVVLMHAQTLFQPVYEKNLGTRLLGMKLLTTTHAAHRLLDTTWLLIRMGVVTKLGGMVYNSVVVVPDF